MKRPVCPLIFPPYFSLFFPYFSDWRTGIAALPESKAWEQLDKAYLNGSISVDPNTTYRVNGQRRGFTTNYQAADPNTGEAVPVNSATVSSDGWVPDPYGGHGGNDSWYLGGFGFDASHVVDVEMNLLPGQLQGGEFHSDFFGPLGPLLPFHLPDAAASYVLPNGSWQVFICSINGGCVPGP